MPLHRLLLVSGSAHFSTRDVWDGYRVALESQGVHVIPYPTFSFLQVLSPDAVCNDIIGTALDVSKAIDAVVFVDGLYFRGQRARVPQSIRAAGRRTVLISTDDPYETIPNVESLYTDRFTNEIRSAVQGVDYLPTATLPLPDVPRVLRPKYDVSFLGTVFEDRLPLLLRVAELCEQERKRFLVAGKIIGDTSPFSRFASVELRRRTIDTLEKWEIYSQSRVTLNLFRQSEAPADSPSPRVFEVTAFGQAALVTGARRSEVTRLFGDSVYHFDDEESAVAVIREALSDDAGRVAKAERAREITLNAHLYEHRAQTLLAKLREREPTGAPASDSEEQLAWIIGCGRTGSTWLAEMLGDLPNLRRWHEPYFGRFLRHVHERPEDLERHASFYTARHRRIWVAGLRTMFFDMVRERFPQFGRHSLVVKEVNTPEFYAWLRVLFPTSRVILLARDPYDVLDSYLDLQKPGSWNTQFGGGGDPLEPANVRRTAEHIRQTMGLAADAYESHPVEQRLWLTYESLLEDPAPGLQACGRLVGVEVTAEDAAQVAQQHSFSRQKQTGALQFRRRAQSGGWRDSENFTSEVREIARELLGAFRARLGYRDE